MQESQQPISDNRRLLDQFLQNPQAVFQNIPEAGASDSLKAKLAALFEFLHELVRAGKFEEAKILIACNRKVGQGPDILREAKKFAELHSAVIATLDASPSAALMLLQSLGLPGWRIIAALADNDNPQVRQLVCKTLAGAGEKCVPLLLEVYENNKKPALITSMLNIFSNVGARGEGVVSFYKYSLRHPDPAVRLAAIPVVIKVLPKEAEELLIPLMSDKDSKVLATLVKGFETVGITSVEAVQLVLDIVSGFIKVEEPVLLQTLRTLRKIDAKPFNGTTLAQDLNNYIGERGLFSFLSKKPKMSREVELAVIMALGNVGSWVNSDKLEMLKSDKDLAIASAAADTLALIKKKA